VLLRLGLLLLLGTHSARWSRHDTVTRQRCCSSLQFCYVFRSAFKVSVRFSFSLLSYILRVLARTQHAGHGTTQSLDSGAAARCSFATFSAAHLRYLCRAFPFFVFPPLVYTSSCHAPSTLRRTPSLQGVLVAII
jgi:hypothetical protein